MIFRFLHSGGGDQALNLTLWILILVKIIIIKLYNFLLKMYKFIYYIE